MMGTTTLLRPQRHMQVCACLFGKSSMLHASMHDSRFTDRTAAVSRPAHGGGASSPGTPAAQVSEQIFFTAAGKLMCGTLHSSDAGSILQETARNKGNSCCKTLLHACRRQRRAVLDSDTDEVAEAEPAAEDPGTASCR
jgi:hypothetical protein